ncbi:MAG: hypothetical protein VYE73_17720, partial [Acidobacteriota bacterium]|nr:hypothetical protein [Acidobacteriota bacterium]
MDLADEFRELCPRSKVIFMSGYREYPGDSRLERASARLQKPFSPSELVRAIRVALDTEPDTSPSHVATAVA